MYEHHPDDNSLTYLHSLYVPFLVDNVFVNNYDQIIVAGHPNALTFLFHQHNPRKNRAPSEVVIFTNPKSSKSYSFLCIK